ncbi:Uncharacterised protein [Enterococcus durans]|uniref:Uncharacterized protein n=1 Tax=Enterococcus durans TaxID=53345 RepID=A0A377KN50_9ENTE|nr:Uncharacterised protein [Enterococcus durans]
MVHSEKNESQKLLFILLWIVDLFFQGKTPSAIYSCLGCEAKVFISFVSSPFLTKACYWCNYS